LTVGRVGAQRLRINNVIHNPKESKELLAFGEDAMQKLYSQIREVSPDVPNIIYDCSLSVDGVQCPYTILIRVLWDGDDKCFSRLLGKLINTGGKPCDNDLNVQTQRDLLTGLYTRKAARKIIEKRLLQRKNESYLMILLDIDKLKSINDYYGHGVGDNVLCDFANKCESLLGADGVAARVGGDEFMLFMRCEKNAAEEVYRIYDELCADFRMYAATASFGVSLCSADGVMYDELYHKADVALHFAKQSHTPICFYSENLPDFPHIHTPIDSQSERAGSPDGVLPA
ncbi:MAG: GGDEF domain-containing protein, partial [Acutalibacteraceae bacterium]